MAKSKFSDIDEYGFQRPDNFDYTSYEEIMSKYFKILTNRRMKWDQYMKTKPNLLNTKNNKLKRFIRKGIPGHLRSEMWMIVSGALTLQSKSPLLYQNLLAAEHNTEITDAIKIDLPRTFPDNIYFETMELNLFNVLTAYAHHNVEIGYCQGLNYIAGLILLVTKDEEQTFWLLKILIENIVPSYHSNTMSGLIIDIAVLEKLLKLRVPEIMDRLNDFGLPCAVVTTKWLICLFAEVLPIETVLRIWDCLFNEGYKILFRVSLTLIIRHKQEIMATEDISALANLFREIVNNSIVTNCHEFMQSIFVIPGTLKRSDIKRLRAESMLTTVGSTRTRL